MSVSLVWTGPPREPGDDTLELFCRVQAVAEGIFGSFMLQWDMAVDGRTLLDSMGVIAPDDAFIHMVLSLPGISDEHEISAALSEHSGTADAVFVLSVWDARIADGHEGVLKSPVILQLAEVFGALPRIVLDLPKWIWS